MSDRQSTPDIMAALMDGQAIRQENNKAIKQEPPKAAKPERNTTSKQESNKASEPAITEISEEPKEKATFNLTIKVLDELEEKWMELRKLTGSKQLSKTLIVEEALKMAFVEYDAKKQESKFYSKLASNKAIKQ